MASAAALSIVVARRCEAATIARSSAAASPSGGAVSQDVMSQRFIARIPVSPTYAAVSAGFVAAQVPSGRASGRQGLVLDGREPGGRFRRAGANDDQHRLPLPVPPTAIGKRKREAHQMPCSRASSKSVILLTDTNR